MIVLFVASAFLAAALLFAVQPLAGKPLLTLAGGSPSVWTGAMLFFQAALLLGYALAHALAAGRSVKRRGLAIALLAGGAIAAMLTRVPDVPADATTPPMLWVLSTLALWLGAPFVAMATLSPLLQRWFSLTNHPRARDPYFLSVASNLGSAAGLLAYPLVVERSLTQTSQWKWWGIAMGGLVLLVAPCAALARGAAPQPQPDQPSSPHAAAPSRELPSRPREALLWIALAFIPSSLMLGLTQHITTDIAPVPLLWVMPLLLYLLTFALAFTPEGLRPRWWQDANFWSRAIVIPLLTLTLAMLLHARTPVLLVLALHIFVFFAGAMLCHRRLALLRPSPNRLTTFYFAIAIGGVLGGIANALVAPLILDRILEYPIALAALVAARRVTAQSPHAPGTRPAASLARWFVPMILPAVLVLALAALSARLELARTIQFALVAGVPTLAIGLLFFIEARRAAPRSTPRWLLPLALAGALIAGEYTYSRRPTLHQERTFFGVHRVERTPEGRFHVLLHGTTAHGVQAAPTHPDRERLRAIPGTYYHPDGPAGSLVRATQATHAAARVGLIGLGTGAIAAYARQSDHFTFFELDPSVVAIADNPAYFTYLADARARGATLRIVVGDGRHTLAREPEASFDLIVIDAFSSDAIPTHLLTREAIEVYLARLAPGGVLALHISNRAFNLAPVLCRHAQDLGLAALDNDDTVVTRKQLEEGKTESWWFALARDSASLEPLRSNNLFWRTPTDLARTDLPLWTDQRSDLLSVLIW